MTLLFYRIESDSLIKKVVDSRVKRLPIGSCLDLHRKEVIQAHLPVHLPCSDFVPVTDPTFDSSLPYGLGYRLQVLPASIT